MPEHKTLTEIHNAAFVGSADPFVATPADVRANLLWVDTTDTPYELKIRNADNSAWLEVASALPGAGTVTIAMLDFDPATQAELDAINTTLTAAAAAAQAAADAAQGEVDTLETAVAALPDGSGAAGRVAFWSDINSLQALANTIFWDAVNSRLGIGTEAPLSGFHIAFATRFSSSLTVQPTTGTATGIVASPDAGSIVRNSGAAGFGRDFQFQTLGVNRWLFRVNSDAEAGANAGSNFEILARQDDGSANGSALTINRSTLAAIFGGILSASNINAAFVGGAGTAALLAAANTFTSPQVISSGATAAYITMDGNAGTSRGVRIRSAGLLRWLIGVSNAAESGSNAGTNFLINRYDDAGTLIDVIMTIARATGNTTFAGNLAASNINTAFVGGAGTASLLGTAQTYSAKKTFSAGTAGLKRTVGGWVSEATPAVADHYGSITIPIDEDLTVTGIAGYAITPPTGSAAVFDIEYKRGGGGWTTLFSSLPSFAAASNTPSAGTLAVTQLNAGDYLRLNWDAVNAIAGVSVFLQTTTR
jgi:hypothetical protein